MLVRSVIVAAGCVVVLSRPADAQELSPCHFVCELEWKVEPTFTVEHLLQRHRIREAGGAIKRVSPELVFETVLALDLKTK